MMVRTLGLLSTGSITVSLLEGCSYQSAKIMQNVFRSCKTDVGNESGVSCDSIST
jgi:hypothetical protein